jgi:hypothetical protein
MLVRIGSIVAFEVLSTKYDASVEYSIAATAPVNTHNLAFRRNADSTMKTG